ncbi:MAG: type II toxin-antitoxin system RelE/ParE family toxin [Lewinellaceae bacterium]|nr:type II toxin-antitoxin system RelE/ParE family toxin [Lewinellaceae bacterium]
MREIKVKQQFLDSVLEIRDYIAQDSPQNAADFVSGLKSKMQKIVEQPETFSPEKNLLTKRFLYRFARYKKSYKIIFKVLDAQLVFLDIVHGKRHPSYLKKLKTTDYE